jgi:NTP pyrophosphatase (non-canonical NTP hydrolase)
MSRPGIQSDISFEAISQIIWKHLEERDWHNGQARSLAVSIALEANELLEHYQWSDRPVGDKQALAEELADIFIYAFQFAQQHNIDIAEAIKQKLAKAAIKYPAKDFKGKQDTDRREAWIQAKTSYKKEGL